MPRNRMERVERLENTLESLAGLPVAVGELRERVIGLEGRASALESQIVQLRAEMRNEFSTVRLEMTDMRIGLKGDIASVRQELSDVRTELKGDVATVRQDLTSLVTETRDSLSSQMRMLHEDLISRIALIADGRSARKRRRH